MRSFGPMLPGAPAPRHAVLSLAKWSPHRAFAALACLLVVACAAPALGHPEIDEEIEEASKQISSSRDPAAALLARGELYRLAKHWKEARADYDRAAALNPQVPGLELCRATLTLDQGRAAEAREALDRYLAREPRDPQAWNLRARASEALGLVDEAAADLARVIEFTPRPTPDLYLERSRLLVKVARQPEALRCLDAGIARLGPIVTLELAAIDLELARGNSTGALARLDQVEAQMERPQAMLLRRAEILAAAGDVEGARRARAAAADAPSKGQRRWAPGAGLMSGQEVLPSEPPSTSSETDDGRPFPPEDPPATSVVRPAAPAGVLEVVTRGPYLQIGTPNSITIRWRTDVPSSSRVLYGTALGALTSSTQDVALTTEHEIRLTGLTPDQRYYYAIGTTTTVLEGNDAEHSFMTSPTPGTPKPTRIWIIGDAGTGSSGQAAVRDAFVNYSGTRAADVWLMLGDNAYSAGTDAEYQSKHFAMYTALLKKTILWPTRGNHDVTRTGANNDYYEFFSMPTAGEAGGLASGTEAYYSYDYGSIHFICLDSEGSDRSPSGAMATWLKADLAATGRDWVIAFWHHPPYTKGSHDSDDIGDSGGRMRDMRANILPILDSAGVDMVLTGHSHSYERSVLLDRHYGTSSTLTSAMKIDPGNGRESGDGAYSKTTVGTAPHEGCVYAVAGSSGQTSGGSLNHPVMVSSLNVLGSMVVDVNGNRLDARFLDNGGAVRDNFTILKGAPSADTIRPAAITDLGSGTGSPIAAENDKTTKP